MAKKPKTKDSVFGTTCTQDSSGVWSWTVVDCKWVWWDSPGLNTEVSVNDGPATTVAFFAKLDLAVAFSQGVKYGMDIHTRIELK